MIELIGAFIIIFGLGFICGSASEYQSSNKSVSELMAESIEAMKDLPWKE